MPYQILPKEESFASRLGTSLGGGLGKVLEGLATDKIRQIQSQRFKQSGLPEVLAYLDPQSQAAFLKEMGAAQKMQQAQAAEQQQAEAFRNLLSQQGSISPEQLPEASKLNLSQLKDFAKVQKDIEEANATFTADARKAYNIGHQMKADATRMRELLATGKVATGFAGTAQSLAEKGLGKDLSKRFKSAETQEYEKRANNLALLKSSGPAMGVASRWKIELNQSAKPQISDDLQAQENILDAIEEEAEAFMNPYTTIKDLTEKSKGPIPNLEQIVLSQLDTRQVSNKLNRNLPASKHKGKKVRDKETGQIFISNGKSWELIKEEENGAL